ncbi:MAG: Holliday junction branch migration protein RuvA [Flavobacteriaceae bacterium TMED120]|nr:MAG: Holliday junction branch migration protein RuvA [Flavobacteriaceae bacterium TMED120]CAI8261976.1 MAG: Holliday junction ATP-dependent DNA helicase RuvA [Flavobacteriaceae bacterium]HCQ24375.1 Holliday junction branch migration protein RuvA [Flavobacteriaceae bacterium]|tara:strand:+ start:1676 stop:2257 length:582 start_codon:yes stop_codon:yes gene_type:complete
MITQIQGKLVEKYPTHVVVDCNGIGYEVHISLHTFGQLPSEEAIKLYTHLLIREDAHTLYGFASHSERALFRLLIGVSGIGASTARTMLSSLEPLQIQKAILTEDVPTIQSIKGIGLKTAQRVIIELLDKIKTLPEMEQIEAISGNTIKEEALSALEVLGYPRRSSEKVIDNLIQSQPDTSVEMLIKAALNKL